MKARPRKFRRDAPAGASSQADPNWRTLKAFVMGGKLK
jgi:hypothetical protein